MYRFISLVLFSLALTPVQAKTLKIATAAPDGTMWMQELRSAAKSIEERTSGRVDFRFYPGGVMGSDKSVLRKIRIGQLHGGLITGGGLATVYSDANLYNLPFMFQTYDEVDYIRSKMDPVILKGLEEQGYKSFGFSEGGFAYMMANKPLYGISDLEGLKVWIPEGDRISKAAFEAAEISPLPLPLADVLTGLQTGLIDTVAASPVGTIALQWHTQVSYLTDAPLMYLYGGMMVKKSAFERLSRPDQVIVEEEMGKAFKRINDQNRADDSRALEVLKTVGIQFVEPPKEEQASWRKLSDAAIQELLSSDHLTKANYEKMLKLLADYRESR
ncbi:MAG: TRAP transporter substrate-binding protein DctP [Gammaproteobacteria bacterium]|nr:TRAP transporter substrate-binding protein DctP [Gammaproteobacteria bacterium]